MTVASESVTLAQLLAAVQRLEAKIDSSFKRLGIGDELPVTATGDEVTLNELVPLMPKGLRSRASIHRLLAARAITGRKARGRWTFRPQKVLSDLNNFERVSSVSSFLSDQLRKASRKKKR